METTKAIEMIQSGEGKVYYEDWARDGDLSVKCELAKRGYCAEYFLDDDTPFVTAYALQAHPEYLPKLIESTKDHQIWAVHEVLIDKRDATGLKFESQLSPCVSVPVFAEPTNSRTLAFSGLVNLALTDWFQPVPGC